MEEKKNKANQLKTFAKFSGIGLQIGLTIYMGNLLGTWLDEKYPNPDEWYTKGVTLAAVFLATYSIIKQVTRMTSGDK